jgi:hypothetical protein
LLVASDGGIFTFGDAQFFGSTGAMHLSAPIDGMAPSATGYWLMGEDGSVYTFGNTASGGSPINNPAFDGFATSITSTADRLGYWITDADGDVFAYGDAVAYPPTG